MCFLRLLSTISIIHISQMNLVASEVYVSVVEMALEQVVGVWFWFAAFGLGISGFGNFECLEL